MYDMQYVVIKNLKPKVLCELIYLGYVEKFGICEAVN
jgi:hypothetical protein